MVDVRAVPQSRKPGFSKRLMAAGLAERGIGYVHLQGLGTPKSGRDAVRAGRVEEMRAIFSDHMGSDRAQAELAQAVELARGGRACLLCFEHDHRTCHRLIVAELIATRTGQEIMHLDPLAGLA